MFAINKRRSTTLYSSAPSDPTYNNENIAKFTLGLLLLLLWRLLHLMHARLLHLMHARLVRNERVWRKQLVTVEHLLLLLRAVSLVEHLQVVSMSYWHHGEIGRHPGRQVVHRVQIILVDNAADFGGVRLHLHNWTVQVGGTAVLPVARVVRIVS